MAGDGMRRTGGHGGRVVIVGAGQAGSDTAAALRARGFDGPVTLVGDETSLPYRRPPLCKDFPAGRTEPEELLLRPASFYADQEIELLRGDRAVEIDRDGRRLALDSGRELPYDRLVLATGARPRPLPVPGADLAGVLTLRGLADAKVLRGYLRQARRLVVVGGGFIGMEIAATARGMGVETTLVEAGHRVMARATSVPLSSFLVREHRRHGVRVLCRREVRAIEGDRHDRVAAVELDGGERVTADLVLVAVGVLPTVDLAAAAGLAVGGGVLVDRRLRTSDRAIYAVGDCARFPGPHSRRMLRLESVQNASDQARCVAAALCGEGTPYTAVPWFWSEQYDLRVQLAGLTEGYDRAVLAGDLEGRRFSVFCFRGDRLLGVESVNRAADHMISRRLLASGDDCVLTPAEVARPDFDLKKHHAPATAELSGAR